MSRMEAGKAAVQRLPVAPEQLVLQASDDFRTAFLDRGVNLKLDLPPDVPQVLVDPARIKHVFSNLLNNALKHTPPGGSVSVSARSEGAEVRFAVEDTGAGIPAEYLPRVFEEFFRVPGQDQESDTGLGLAIVKEIVELHGGRIEAQSEPGKGAKFVFTLKVAEPTGNRTFSDLPTLSV